MTMVLLASGCSNGSSAASSDNDKTLYFIPIVDTGAYWNPMKKGAEDAAKELGYTLVTKTSPSAEPSKKKNTLGLLKKQLLKMSQELLLRQSKRKPLLIQSKQQWIKIFL